MILRQHIFHEGAGALPERDIAFGGQAFIGHDDGVARKTEFLGHDPAWRQARSGRYDAVPYPAAQLLEKLLVQGRATAAVEGDPVPAWIVEGHFEIPREFCAFPMTT